MEIMLTEKYRGGLIFYDESSYSMKALRYVERTSVGMEDWRIGNRFALACIYYATNAIVNSYSIAMIGTLALGWLRPWLDLSGLANECEWPGIVCTDTLIDANGNAYGNITHINLSGNRLMGTFPPEVQIFHETLELLDLEINFLHNVGQANLAWLGSLTELRVLRLGETGFDSENTGLPTELAHLVHLEELSVYNTYLSGTVNESILTSMSNLVYFDMGGVAVSGSPLPTALGHLSNLKYLYLDHSDYSTELSTILDGTGFPVIEDLWLDVNNDIGGTIPNTIGAYTTLKSLSLTHCKLKETIPTELGLLTSLKYLWLYGNALSGSVPTELGSLTTVERLFLHENDLTGTLPSEICLHRHGSLAALGLDCGTETPEVTCGTMGLLDCCTCCGNACSY